MYQAGIDGKQLEKGTHAYKVEQLKKEKEFWSNTVSELKDLVNIIKNGKQSQDPSIISHILSSEKVCIHYTGFSVTVCKAIFTYLDPGKNGRKNMVLYHNQNAKEKEEEGKEQSYLLMDSFYA